MATLNQVIADRKEREKGLYKKVKVVHLEPVEDHHVVESAYYRGIAGGKRARRGGAAKAVAGAAVNLAALPFKIAGKAVKTSAAVASAAVAHPFDLLGETAIAGANALAKSLGAADLDAETHLKLAQLGEYLSQDVDALQSTLSAVVLRVDALEKNVPVSSVAQKAFKKQDALGAVLTKAARPVVAAEQVAAGAVEAAVALPVLAASEAAAVVSEVVA